MSWRRPAWIRLDRYIAIHDSYIRDLEQTFVEHDGCSFDVSPSYVVVQGRIRCRHGIFLDVYKLLYINSEQQVSGRIYSYQACIQTDAGVRHIFRYDNADRKTREGHPDAYHLHVHDPLNPEQLDLDLIWIGKDDWPTLGEVLAKLQEWWQETGQHLRFDG